MLAQGFDFRTLKSYLKENMDLKINMPEIPDTAKAVLQQQFILGEAIETWIDSVKESLDKQY